MFALLLIIVLLIAMLVSNIRIVRQATAQVVERLGAYKETWGVGLHLLVPFIDRVAGWSP